MTKSMKTFLKWILPIFILAILSINFFLYSGIERKCTPSFCGPKDPQLGVSMCTADCSGERDYSIVYIVGAVNLLILICWIALMIKKTKTKS